MLEEVEKQILKDLHQGSICRTAFYCERFPGLKQIDVIQAFVDIFRKDRNQNFDLLCHITIVNDKQARIQMERYSNIQRGILIENSNHHNTYAINREHIRQMKILAIFPMNLSVSEVEQMLQFSTSAKTKQYTNKFVLLPKLIIENNNLLKNKSKKQEKKPQKQVENKQKQKNVIEPKNVVKKTETKPSIEVEQKRPNQLKKVSSKDQGPPAPVLTKYEAERAKLEEPKAKQSKKLCLDSDQQQYYNPTVLLEQLNPKNDQNLETDHSGKKTVIEGEKMEIESEGNKLSKFIVEDDDSEDIFAKIDEAEKKNATQSLLKTQSMTTPKNSNLPTPPSQKAKIQTKKPNNPLPSKSQNPPAPVSNKSTPSLMGWLKPKKV